MKSDFRSDSFKKNSDGFFLSRIRLFDALKGTQEIIPKMLLNIGMKKLRLKFNLGLALISLQTNGPWDLGESQNSILKSMGRTYLPTIPSFFFN